MFDKSSDLPKVTYVSIVEAGEDPTKVDSWPDPKWSLSTFPLRSLLYSCSGKTNPLQTTTAAHTLGFLSVTPSHLGAKL